MEKAPRNKTIEVAEGEIPSYASRCRNFTEPLSPESFGRSLDNEEGGVLCLQDCLELLPRLPPESFDLIIADPPYNLRKNYHGNLFKSQDFEDYKTWVGLWMAELARLLKRGGSLYVCSDWRSSMAVQVSGAEFLSVQNRITWEREKGRGSPRNWKNSCEDIWFFTKDDDYYFDVDAVKLRRRVLAPYRVDGQAKDWHEDVGGAYRDTHPGNFWTDLTVPFWSMGENTPHPTQKPEKLFAKLILASSKPGGLVLDPFSGSGTSLVCARKLGRRWVGIEQHPFYAALAWKRLDKALEDPSIQGYEQGIFYERNARPGSRVGLRQS